MAAEPESEKFAYKPGVTVGEDYILQEFLGKGGMGVVFRASHRFIKQDYAIKLLPIDLLTEENWLRFQREAQALAKLNHPGIVRIFNMGIDRQRSPYYVMELLIGISLADALKERGPMPQPDALACFLKVASALEAAHKQHIIHRDVKPANIMLLAPNGQPAGHTSQGPSVKLVDFGLARVIENKMMEQSLVRAKEEQNLTRTGNVFGSPLYMSPEQCRGELLDVRSDIYSFGCSFFEALTGLVPFHGQTPLETFMMHESKNPPKLREMSPLSTFSDDLENAVARMMAKRKEDRYQNMDRVIHDLERISAGKPITIQSQSIETAVGTTEDMQTQKSPHVQNKGLVPALSILALLLITGTIIGAVNYFQSSAKSFDRMADPLQPNAFRTPEEADNKAKATANTKRETTGSKIDVTQIEKSRISEGTKPAANASNNATSAGDQKPNIIRKQLSERTVELNFISDLGSMSYYKDRSGGELVAADPRRLVIQTPAIIGFALSDCPISNLKVFQEGDIEGLKIEDLSSSRQFEQFIEIARAWKRLDFLSFDNASLLGAKLSGLDSLPYLTQLKLVNCDLDKKALVGLRCLKKLNSFTLINASEKQQSGEAQQIAALVEALAQNRNLRTLEIKGQTISHLEMKRLLKMPSLRKLTVFGYKWNEENLAALRDESHIKFLAVSEDDIPEMRLRLLTRAKHLAGMEIGEVSSYKMKARLLAMQPYLVDASGKKIELMVTLKSKVLYAL